MALTTQHSSRAAAVDVVRQIAGHVLNLGLGVVVTGLLVRGLGEADFGRWMTALVVIQMVDYFTSFGLEQVAVRYAATESSHEDRARWVDALVSLRMTLALVALPIAVGLVFLLEEDAEMRATGVILAFGLLLGGPSMMRVHFRLRLRNDVPVFVSTFNSIVWGAGVVALYLLDGPLVAFAIVFVGVAVLTTALQVVLAWRLAPLRLLSGARMWRPLLRVGVPVGITGLLTLAYARIDQILVFELAGQREAGLYGAVYRVLEQSHFVPIAIMATLAPMTAAALSDPPRLRMLVGAALHLLLVVSLAGLAVSIALAGPIVELLFGSEFRDAAPVLPVLSAAFVAICFGYVTGNLVLLFDLQRRLLAMAAVGLVFNVALNAVLIPAIGYIAAAWLTLATELVVLGPMLIVVLRRIGPGTVPVAAAARTLVAATLLGLILEGLERAGAPLAVPLVLAAPLYAGLCIATRAVDVGAVRRLLSERETAPASA